MTTKFETLVSSVERRVVGAIRELGRLKAKVISVTQERAANMVETEHSLPEVQCVLEQAKTSRSCVCVCRLLRLLGVPRY